jgi:hypothetical protein
VQLDPSVVFLPELMGCAIVPGVGPLAPVAPTAEDILTWFPHHTNTPIIFANRVSQSLPSLLPLLLLLLLLLLSPSSPSSLSSLSLLLLLLLLQLLLLL